MHDHLQVVHADGQPAGLGHGDRGRLVELPADVGRGPQLVEGEGAALQGPQRHVLGDALAVDDHVDAVEQAGGDPAVVGVAQLELEAGDPAVLEHVAESAPLDDCDVEHGHFSSSVSVRAMSRAPATASATEVRVGLQAVAVGMTPLPAT